MAAPAGDPALGWARPSRRVALTGERLVPHAGLGSFGLALTAAAAEQCESWACLYQASKVAQVLFVSPSKEGDLDRSDLLAGCACRPGTALSLWWRLQVLNRLEGGPACAWQWLPGAGSAASWL